MHDTAWQAKKSTKIMQEVYILKPPPLPPYSLMDSVKCFIGFNELYMYEFLCFYLMCIEINAVF